MKLAFHIQQLKLMTDYARAISFLEYRQSFSRHGNNGNSCHCLLNIYQIAVAQLNRGKKDATRGILLFFVQKKLLKTADCVCFSFPLG